MTKNSMLMQTPYFSVVEGFRQFVRDSVRTEKDHYRWVNLYGEKGLDDPNPKVVEIQDEKAEQLAVACATLAYLTLSVYYGRNKFADTTFAELEGEDYSKFLRQAHAIVMSNNRRQLIPISFTSVKKIREWHDNIIPIGTYVTTGKMKIKKDSKFKNLKLPKDCVRLTTTRQMVMEGNFQHNCVATYISKVNKDECSIWSQRKSDGTRNTIEIGIEHGKYCIIQMCAFANQEPMQKDLEKVQKAIDKCNDRRNKECLRKSV